MLGLNLKQPSLLLLGCGRMGSALLKGWIKSGISTENIVVLEPNPSTWLLSLKVSLNCPLPEEPPNACILAVKPQMIPGSLYPLASLGGKTTLILSIAAGIRIDTLVQVFGANTPVIRSMPNTPSAIGQGISALIGNNRTNGGHYALAESLLSAVGETVRIETEDQMDAVTALSGSGPAYIFHMIEALTEAGISQGLPSDISLQLAKSTVDGAGRLAMEDEKSPSQLRIDVSSPGGTTEAALNILMNQNSGLVQLMKKSVRAAAERSRELGVSNG